MRNFLYNKSDILIAVIIIAVAAIIIWTRIGAIMGSSGDTGTETPSVETTQEADTPEGAGTADNGTSAPAVGEDPAATGTEGTEVPAAEGEGTTSEAAVDGTGEEVSGEVVEFTIELGASSGSVAQDLEDAGIIKADDFIKEIKAQDKEGSIKVGTFKLKATMTAKQIVNKVTN